MKDFNLIKILFLLFIFPPIIFSQNVQIQRIDPTYWWVGMRNQNLQLLVYGKNIKDSEVSLTYEGVTIENTQLLENPNYMVIDLKINSNALPGKVPLLFSRFEYQTVKKKEELKKVVYTQEYELKAREPQINRIKGISSSDFIYLIMPDRFANAEPSNDVILGMKEEKINRDSLTYRHGGDLQGITQHLDYLKDLGITALWLNPVIENDQPKDSYHGYAFTDHYAVDRRLGGKQAYKDFIDAAHAKGMKVVQDIVLNHIGNHHWLFENLPFKDFVNQWDGYKHTNFRDETLMDIYGAEIDKKIMSNGWFAPTMPDLNQSNPIVANYLTQNALWWIEAFGIDAFRVDTYAYSDLKFEEKFFQAIQDEYTTFSAFGETWVHSVPNQSFFTKNNVVGTKHRSTLGGVTDFQLHFATNDALNQNFGWTEGLNRIYRVLASDFLYKDPNKNVTFLDNHDTSRFFSVIGESIGKYKMGIGFLLTTRGIPSMYYGTELLFKGFDIGGGISVRQEMPGGWSGDIIDKFMTKGRTEKENEAFNFVKKLANYRKNSAAIQTGKLMQFVPESGVYTYFRYDAKTTVMVVMNQNKEEKRMSTDRFAERMAGFKSAKNIVTDELIQNLESLKIPAMSTTVFELKK